MNELERIINDAWENKDQINQNSEESIINAINHIIEDLDQGKVRVAEKINGKWITHQHIKKAITKIRSEGRLQVINRGKLKKYLPKIKIDEQIIVSSTGTGTGTLFQTELSVGDVIQIDDETFLTEDDVEILMENDEKLAHEPILISKVSSEVMSQVQGLKIRDFK